MKVTPVPDTPLHDETKFTPSVTSGCDQACSIAGTPFKPKCSRRNVTTAHQSTWINYAGGPLRRRNTDQTLGSGASLTAVGTMTERQQTADDVIVSINSRAQRHLNRYDTPENPRYCFIRPFSRQRAENDYHKLPTCVEHVKFRNPIHVQSSVLPLY